VTKAADSNNWRFPKQHRKSLFDVKGLHGHRLGFLQSCCCDLPGHCLSMGSLKQFSKRSMATGITGGTRVRISRICFPQKFRSCLCLSIDTCLPCVCCTLHSAFRVQTTLCGTFGCLTAAVSQICCAVLCCAVLCCAVLCCALACPMMR